MRHVRLGKQSVYRRHIATETGPLFQQIHLESLQQQLNRCAHSRDPTSYYQNRTLHDVKRHLAMATRFHRTSCQYYKPANTNSPCDYPHGSNPFCIRVFLWQSCRTRIVASQKSQPII
jgi:hypothetical protein